MTGLFKFIESFFSEPVFVWLLISILLAFLFWSNSLRRNLSRLASRDRKERLAAVHYMGFRKGEIALDSLLDRLDDEDREIRRRSREYLDRLGVSRERLVLAYVRALSSTTEEASKEAVNTIIELTAKWEMTDAFIDGLIEKMCYVAEKSRSEDEVEPEKMQGEIVREARTYINAKRVWESVLTTRELKIRGYKRALLSKQYELHEQAVEELEYLCETKEELFNAYLEAMRGPFPYKTAAALAKFNDERAKDPIYRALARTTSTYWRGRLAMSLGLLGDRRAARVLIKYIESETHPKPRKEAIKILGALKHPAAVDLLFGLVGNPYGGPGKVPHWEGSEHQLATDALLGYDQIDPSFMSKIVGLLTSPGSWHINSGLAILKKHTELHEWAVPPLVPWLSGFYNKGAKEALIAIGGPNVIQMVEAAYKGRSQDEGFESAREVLMALGARSQAEHLPFGVDPVEK